MKTSEDFVQFAKEGALGWAPCSPDNTPAKCYAYKDNGIAPMVAPDISREFDKTKFKKQCCKSICPVQST